MKLTKEILVNDQKGHDNHPTGNNKWLLKQITVCD